MYRALYRKWRPRTFSDVCGQAHITDVLQYEVEHQKTSHAYLFCGSRGTGKTTCAKLLAKALNCLSPKNGNPCNECEACRSIDAGSATDVVEMDAASNTSVDNVRDIKDEIVFTPAELSYRVYIIDEVHMLSTSAFNALLKTLEEPPSHVVFILATTELQKLPSTIISRCQRFDFRRISVDVIMERLQTIAEAEKIDLAEDGARLIARMAQGGMRDAISLLELCAGQNKKIDLACAEDCLGRGNRSSIVSLVRAVANRDYDAIYEAVDGVMNSSLDLSVFFQGILDYYRDMMIVKTAKSAEHYLDLTEAEAEEIRDTAALFTMQQVLYHTKLLEDAIYAMLRAGFPKRGMAEMTLTRMCDPHLSTTTEALLSRIAKLESEVATLRSRSFLPTDRENSAPLEAALEQPAKAKPEKAQKVLEKEHLSASKKPSDQETYTALPRFASIVDEIRRVRSSIAGFLDGAKAYRAPDGGVLIRVRGKLGTNILSRPDTLAILQSAIVSELGDAYNAPPTVESIDIPKAGFFLDELASELGDNATAF